MAIVVEAGPPAMMSRPAGEARRLEIRQISVADLIECIEKGVKDFTRSFKYGMFFGGFYAVGGALIVWLAVYTGYWYLAYPLIMGFALLAPFGAVGTYEISRRLEAGQPLSWTAVLGAVWSRAGQDLGWLSLVSLFTFMIWMDIAFFVYLMFYGSGLSVVCGHLRQCLHHALRTAVSPRRQWRSARLSRSVVFSFTAVSPPLVVDRDVDVVTALTTSVRAVRQSAHHARLDGGDRHGPRRVVRHLSVALIVLFPILGHTTWHLYRKLIV